MKPITLLLALLLLPFVASAQTESVKPGINKKFLDPELEVVDWLKRFEIESREVYSAQSEILAACAIQPGMQVADIGAGTGLYTHPFLKEVGPHRMGLRRRYQRPIPRTYSCTRAIESDAEPNRRPLR